MDKAGLLGEIDHRVWQAEWIVDIQAVEHNTEGVLKYLAPYVFRVAISDRRIVNVTGRSVSFRYDDSKTGQPKIMTLDALEFMRRFLQHVLPKGFQKVRYYGFLGSGCALPHEEIVAMIELCLNFECRTPEGPLLCRKKLLCPSCGGALILKMTVLPHGAVVSVERDTT